VNNEDYINQIRNKYPDFDRFAKEIYHLARTVTQGNLEAAYKLATYDLKQKEYEEKLAQIKELNKQQPGDKGYQEKEKREIIATVTSKKEVKAQCFQNIGGMMTFTGALPIIFENEKGTIAKVTTQDPLEKTGNATMNALRQEAPVESASQKREIGPDDAPLPGKTASSIIQSIIKKKEEQSNAEKPACAVQYWVYQLGNNAVHTTSQIRKGSFPSSGKG